MKFSFRRDIHEHELAQLGVGELLEYKSILSAFTLYLEVVAFTCLSKKKNNQASGYCKHSRNYYCLALDYFKR